MNMHFKQRGFIWLEQIFQDIRFSLRMLRKNPVFTAIAVISLALAIGVNTGAFWFVNEMLFRPLIQLRPNEVVSVHTGRQTTGTMDPSKTMGTGIMMVSSGFEARLFSFPEFSLLRESDEVFADVSAIQTAWVSVGSNINAERRWKSAYVVSDNYFSMLGVTPALGRSFLPEESRPNANIPVVVVSRSLWESMGHGSDFSESTMAIDGKIYSIVGVAPKGFSGTSVRGPDIWLPIGMASEVSGSIGIIPSGGSGQDLADPATYALAIIARLQPGLALKTAKARLPVLAERLATIAADADEGGWILEIEPPSRYGFSLWPSKAESWEMYGSAILMMVIPGVVLLVACLNLANMFLARNITRSDELAMRLALGASRRRVVRILSVEGLIIALLGGAAGLLISRLGIALLLDSLMSSPAYISSGVSLTLDTTPDVRVLLATFLFCGIATLVFAAAPAWRITRDIARGSFSLQHSTRTTTDRWGRLFSGRHCLLMAQLAFSLVLLFCAGSFLRTAMPVTRPDLGFEPEGNLVGEIDYSLDQRDQASMLTSITALWDGLRALPDVQKVAFASDFPFANPGGNMFSVSAVGAANQQEGYAGGVLTAVSRGYFDVLGIKLLRGRDFTEQECLQAKGPSVVIIDQGTASALFPDEDPVGKYIQDVPFSFGPDAPPGAPDQARTSEPMQIVGVVSAHMDYEQNGSQPLHLFVPLAKASLWKIFVLMRGQTTEAAASGTFRELVRSRLLDLDPDTPLVRLTPYSDILSGDAELWALRSAAVLLGIFGAIALLLAVIGVYGVNGFLIARRMREIGVRMALGASRRRIYALLMKQGAVLIAIGLCVGLMLSVISAKLPTILFSIYPKGDLLELSVLLGDPLVLALTALLLVLAALLAIWIPARRAAKVDPMEVLRWE